MEAPKLNPELGLQEPGDHQEESNMETALILGASALFVLIASSMLTAILIFSVMKVGY